MIVLDASALLAFMFREPGHRRVSELIEDCCVSTVNLAEVIGRFVRDGHDGLRVWNQLRATSISWIDLTQADAVRAGALVQHTQRLGLSLGDRACLALGLSRRAAVVTADRAWAELDLDIAIEVIR